MTQFATAAARRLRERVERYLDLDDLTLLEGVDVQRDAAQVARSVVHRTSEPPGWEVSFPDAHAAGCLHWFRAQWLDPDGARVESGRALAFFMLLFGEYPGSVPESALTSLNEAVSGYAASDLTGPTFWSRSAAGSLQRYEEGSLDPALLCGAIMLLRFSVQATIPGELEHAWHLTNLIRAVRHLPGWARESSLAEEILGYARHCADAARRDDPDRPLFAGLLADVLTDVFHATGDVSLLDEAIAAGSVLAASGSPVHQITLLTATATALHARFSATASLPDLHRAIDLERQAAALASTMPGQQANLLSTLAVSLTDLYQRTGDEAHVREAIEAHRLALDTDGRQAAEYAESNFLLACSLISRFRRTRARPDLDEAAEAAQAATRMAQGDDPSDVARRHGLAALIYQERHEITENPDDLARADRAYRAAADALTGDDPALSAYLQGRALFKWQRWSIRRRKSDLASASRLYRQATGVASAPAVDRLLAATGWARCETHLGRYRSALAAYREALRLLPLAVWHGLELGDRQHLLSAVSGLACDAAAVALTVGEARLALELLEEGRGVLLSQTIDQRHGPALLRHRLPRLARELDDIRMRLEAPTVPSLARPIGPGQDDRRELARRWDILLAEVRSHEEFEAFLRPVPFQDLRAAAEHGPIVVINISPFRSDALIVTRAKPEVVTLPYDTAAVLDDQVAAFGDALEQLNGDPLAAQPRLRAVLAWLGEHIAAPVLDRLDQLGLGGALGESKPPRVWLCPTRQLTFLPLHAGLLPDGTAVFDRCVPSYTMTIRALLEARERRPLPGGPKAMVVCVPQAPDGIWNLPNAPQEAAFVAACLKDTTLLSGPAATRGSVLAQLRSASWFHFAGHAQQQGLAQGGAVLHCWPEGPADTGSVTAADVGGLHLEHAELAVLSACETALGDIDLQDEAAHLAGAFQAAGFKHVVATQWPVNDLAAGKAAASLYHHLADPGDRAAGPDVASAVWHLVREMRADRPRAPSLWAPYLHFGP